MIAILIGCAVHSQKNSDVVKIEFTSLSRGYSKQITITMDSLFKSANEGRGSEIQSMKRKLSSKEWDKLTQALGNISIAEIGDFKSPTMKRTYDGARHSSISITTSKGEITTHQFDDEQPHEKLQKLMNEISKLASKK